MQLDPLGSILAVSLVLVIATLWHIFFGRVPGALSVDPLKPLKRPATLTLLSVSILVTVLWGEFAALGAGSASFYAWACLYWPGICLVLFIHRDR